MESDSRSGGPGKGALEEGGATTTAMPRARIEDDDGRRREWHSRMIPRYQHRAGRRGDFGSIPERHQHAPTARSAFTAVGPYTRVRIPLAPPTSLSPIGHFRELR